MILVAFNLACNRPDNFAELCGNLESTAADPTCFEVLVKIDDGDEPMHQCIAREKARRPFAIKALSKPGEGYFSLWKSLNELHKLCDPDAYFVCNINDEIHFKTRHWDEALRKYVGLFPDHIFRLRVSRFKLRNYVDFWECGYAPENYAFFTKRWIDVAGGDWNACHGPDAFQQFVAYYLWRANYPAKDQSYRDVPIFDIEITGEGAFLGLTEEQFWNRVKKGWAAWYRLVSHEMQTEAKRRARCLQAFIVAKELGYEDFVICDDKKGKRVYVTNRSGQPLYNAEGRPMRFPYRLGRLRITLTNLIRRPMQNYYCGGGREILRETLLNLPFYFFPALHPKGPIGRATRARLHQPLIRFHRITPDASDYNEATSASRLIDGTPDPWGSAETDEDTYFYLTRRRPFRAKYIDLLLHSPHGRAHIKDVSAVGRVENSPHSGEWVVIPARIAGYGTFKKKLTIPQGHDYARIRIELDPQAVRAGRFNTLGLACFSKSRGYRRNYLPEGRGIYVRSMVIR